MKGSPGVLICPHAENRYLLRSGSFGVFSFFSWVAFVEMPALVTVIPKYRYIAPIHRCRKRVLIQINPHRMTKLSRTESRIQQSLLVH